jgi:hypothetical protein
MLATTTLCCIREVESPHQPARRRRRVVRQERGSECEGELYIHMYVHIYHACTLHACTHTHTHTHTPDLILPSNVPDCEADVLVLKEQNAFQISSQCLFDQLGKTLG